MRDDPRRGMPEEGLWTDWRGPSEARRSADERAPSDPPGRGDGPEPSRYGDESRFVSPGRYDPDVWEPEPAPWRSGSRTRGTDADPEYDGTTSPVSSYPPAGPAAPSPAAQEPASGRAEGRTTLRSAHAPLTGIGATGARRLLLIETIVVLALSLGQSAWYSILRMIDRLTSGTPLGKQTSSLNASVTPGRPWLDLTYQLSDIAFGVVPAVLAMLLLMRVSPPLQGVRGRLGLTSPGWWHDVGTGLVIAAFIGIPGIGLYVVSKELGFNTTVQASGLQGAWWVVPVLILSAAMNAVLEETVMVGYLVTRWRQIGWNTLVVVLASALIRGTYHLYQGWGGFAGNIVMGAVFGLVFVRRGRLMPLIVAHTVMDIVSFLGYAFLAGRVSWL